MSSQVPSTGNRPLLASAFLEEYPALAHVTENLQDDFSPLRKLFVEDSLDNKMFMNIIFKTLNDHVISLHDMDRNRQQHVAAVEQQRAAAITEAEHLRTAIATVQQELAAARAEHQRNTAGPQEQQQQPPAIQIYQPEPSRLHPPPIQLPMHFRDPITPSTPSTAVPTPATTPLTPDRYVVEAAPTRPRVADGVVFTGEDEKDPSIRQENYMNWRSMLGIKLTLDRGAYPTPVERIMHTATRLHGEALTRLRPLIDEVVRYRTHPELWPLGWRDYEDMLTYLDHVYVTEDTTAKAHRDFEALQQGSMQFAEFISHFIRLADLSHQPDFLRVIALQRKVNGALQNALVPVVVRPGPEDAVGWIRLLRDLSRNIAERTFRQTAQQPRPAPRPTPARQSPPALAAETPNTDAMQLDAVRVQRNYRSPLPDEEKARRRRLHLCMYCGGTGHYHANCPNKTASRGSNQNASTANSGQPPNSQPGKA